MPAPDRHRRAPGHAWRWWRGRVLVMGPDREPLELAGGAAAVWRALERPSTLAEVVARLAEDVTGAVPTAVADVGAGVSADAVAAVLEQLAARGLVVGTAGP